MDDQSKRNTHDSSLPSFLGVIDSGISRIESFLLAAGVLLLAANTVANVVGRFLLGSSIYFSEELNRILIILITFAGISYAARHGRHIRMSAIYDALPPFGCDIFTAMAVFKRPYIDVIRGTPPFIVMLLSVAIALIFFPQIALFLRDLAFAK